MVKINLKTPYKDLGLLITSINNFLGKYRAAFHDHGGKIGSYFEMESYNNIIQFYKNHRYTIKVMNLKDGAFKYKLTSKGYPENFSYFKITTHIAKKKYEYEVHHNLAIESAHTKNIYLTPDISVIKLNSIIRDDNFYIGESGLCYTPNSNLITFVEAKNYNPFPELLFSFIGILNELHPTAFSKAEYKRKPLHIAPSLFISGSGNIHTLKIKEELKKRYDINIFFSLFYRKAQTYSKKSSPDICKIGENISKSISEEITPLL